MTTSHPNPGVRQRLLYLHARTPAFSQKFWGYTPIEPIKDYNAEITADVPEWRHNTVHDALVDGWRIVQFPHLQAPIDDWDLDVVGYEFILQKLEEVQDG